MLHTYPEHFACIFRLCSVGNLERDQSHMVVYVQAHSVSSALLDPTVSAYFRKAHERPVLPPQGHGLCTRNERGESHGDKTVDWSAHSLWEIQSVEVV